MEQIRGLLLAIDEAVSNGDLQAVGSGYTQDVMHLPPGEPVVVGFAAVHGRDSTYLADFDAELSSSVEEVSVSGDQAFARHSYTESWTSKSGGETTTVNGKGIVLLRRASDGTWKITHWVWNGNEQN